MSDLTKTFEAAEAAVATKPKDAITGYLTVIKSKDNSDATIKLKESSVAPLAELYRKAGAAKELSELLTTLKPLFGNIPKARTAKIVRTIIDCVGDVPNSLELQRKLCLEYIEWAKKEKRAFLRQRLETRLGEVYLKTGKYQDALKVLTALVREVKKLDDKALLVEIQLLESRVHHALRNIPRAKASLTSARAAANAIYCPPLLQAHIDMMAGTILAEEKDYKTAYSYFYESFEGFHALDHPSAVLCLKYMLLTKIMTGRATEVHAIITGKVAINYAGIDVEAMKAVATAYDHRSLEEFEGALKKYPDQLKKDKIIDAHLSDLYDSLLEQNLQRIIEPFSKVEIAHVAKLIDLDKKRVEAKLSQMILDGILTGILDQGAGCLIIFDEATPDESYPLALETIENMGKVVDSLYKKSNRILV